jgi:hypothetical protein
VAILNHHKLIGVGSSGNLLHFGLVERKRDLTALVVVGRVIIVFDDTLFKLFGEVSPPDFVGARRVLILLLCFLGL